MGPHLIRHEKERPWISYYLLDNKRLQGEAILHLRASLKLGTLEYFEIPQEQPSKADN